MGDDPFAAGPAFYVFYQAYRPVVRVSARGLGCRVRACDDRLHGGESADGRLSAADFPEVADSSQDYRLRPADRSHRFGPVSRTGNRTGICRRRVGSRSACLRLCLGALPAGSVCGTRCFLLLSPDRGRVCSRTDVCTGFGGSFSIRRLGKPGSILR